MGLAPTTSTTLMLALGDALAIALLERRGFSRDDYKQLHPGGSLGQAADQRSSDVMHGGDSLPLVTSGHADGRRDPGDDPPAASAASRGAGPRPAAWSASSPDGDLRRNMEDDLLTRPVDEIIDADAADHPRAARWRPRRWAR